MCYNWGLALDLLHWYFDNYAFLDNNQDNDNIDGYLSLLCPFTAHVGWQIIQYKKTAISCGHEGIRTIECIKSQVESALFEFEEIKDTYYSKIDKEKEKGYDIDMSDAISTALELYNLDFDLTNYTIVKWLHSEDWDC